MDQRTERVLDESDDALAEVMEETWLDRLMDWMESPGSSSEQPPQST